MDFRQIVSLTNSRLSLYKIYLSPLTMTESESNRLNITVAEKGIQTKSRRIGPLAITRPMYRPMINLSNRGDSIDTVGENGRIIEVRLFFFCHRNKQKEQKDSRRNRIERHNASSHNQ